MRRWTNFTKLYEPNLHRVNKHLLRSLQFKNNQITVMIGETGSGKTTQCVLHKYSKANVFR